MLAKVLKGSPTYFEMFEQRNVNDYWPLYMMMNLDTKCNYGCRFCALAGEQRKKDMPLTIKQRVEIIQKMAQIGVRALVVIGEGEPTVDFEKFRPVVEAAHREQMITIFFSTISGITPRQINFYLEHNCSIFVTLHSLQSAVYHFLTGCGDLNKVFKNLHLLRAAYESQNIDDKRIVRLGINMPLFRQNKIEANVIKIFTGEDMQFICNPPMGIGAAKKSIVWNELVGEEYDQLLQISQKFSETGGQSSIINNRCSYYFRGIGIDTDGQIISCGYTSQTGGLLGNAAKMDCEDFLAHFHQKQQFHSEFEGKVGHTVCCPPRDNIDEFILLLKNK